MSRSHFASHLGQQQHPLHGLHQCNVPTANSVPSSCMLLWVKSQLFKFANPHAHNHHSTLADGSGAFTVVLTTSAADANLAGAAGFTAFLLGSNGTAAQVLVVVMRLVYDDDTLYTTAATMNTHYAHPPPPPGTQSAQTHALVRPLTNPRDLLRIIPQSFCNAGKVLLVGYTFKVVVGTLCVSVVVRCVNIYNQSCADICNHQLRVDMQRSDHYFHHHHPWPSSWSLYVHTTMHTTIHTPLHALLHTHFSPPLLAHPPPPHTHTLHPPTPHPGIQGGQVG